ncbi:MAG: hypothetical protein AAF702_07155 [Chloroflexota bacterium]
MRLSILTEGLSFVQRLQLSLMKRLIGHEIGPIAMQSYRPNFFGRAYNDCVAEALRKTEFWTKAEAELLGAFVSKQNQCSYCSGAHKAIAVRGMPDEVVDAALNDWQTAPLREQLKRTLGFLQKLTETPGEISAADVAPLRDARVNDQGIREAVYICFVFCTINRLADAFEFEQPTESSYRRMGFTLYNLGYDMAVLPG